MRTLSTDRCTLETLREANAAAMLRVLANPAIDEFENATPPSPQWLAQRYRRLESRGSPYGSQHWRQGIGSRAVRAMLDELREHNGVHTFVAVLKAANFRSAALLRSLGFDPGDPAQRALHRDEPDELVMVRPAATDADLSP